MTRLWEGVRCVVKVSHRFCEATSREPSAEPPNGDLTDSFVPSDGRPVDCRAGTRGRWRSTLGKVTDMQTAPMVEPPGSSVPGVIPEPVRVHDDATAARQRGSATPRTGGTIKPVASPSHRNAASATLTKLLGIIRGNKYMVDAYPLAWRGAGAARGVSDDSGLDHHEVAAGQFGVAAEPSVAEPARPAAPADPTTKPVVSGGN